MTQAAQSADTVRTYLHKSECMHYRCTGCVCACHLPPEPVPDPCPRCVVDGARNDPAGWGYTRYLCPDHGKWVVFRFAQSDGSGGASDG